MQLYNNCLIQNSTASQEKRSSQDGICTVHARMIASSARICKLSYELSATATFTGKAPAREILTLEAYLDGGWKKPFATIGGVITDKDTVIQDFTQKFRNIYSSYKAERLAMLRIVHELFNLLCTSPTEVKHVRICLTPRV
eukprot:TRINITY_DN12332_c0_g1_i5.p1 TRINITY_DN12332_c0_g1~~TRINITY_DN12332_c0_g1_i5.p1  ORF type:complete len:141 (+),score=31.60 TRINITY_DN12332_c0_g1_i5:168-590(+)